MKDSSNNVYCFHLHLYDPYCIYHFPLRTLCPYLAFQENCKFISLSSAMTIWVGRKPHKIPFHFLISHHPLVEYEIQVSILLLEMLNWAWFPGSQFCNPRTHYYGILFSLIIIFVCNSISFCQKKNFSKRDSYMEKLKKSNAK